MNRPESSREPGGVRIRLDASPRGGGWRRAVLAVSLAANVALGWLISAHVRSTADTPGTGVMAASAQPARPGPARRADTAAPDATPPGTLRLDVYEPFAWTMLPAADLAELRDALRGRECPERVVRVILRGILKRELDARIETLLRPVLDNFWGWLDLKEPKKFEVLGNAIEAVQDEIKERYEALIAGFAEPEEKTEKRPDPRYAFLPEDKQQAVAEIERQFDERSKALRHEPSGLTDEQRRAALEALEAEHAAARELSLTEEERQELRLRTSQGADQLRHLQEIELTPAEMRDIAATRDAYAARREAEGESLEEPARDEAMRKLHAAEEAVIRRQLGEERFAEFGRAEDGDYRETLAIVRRLDLPEATGRELWELAVSLYGAHGAGGGSAAAVAETHATATREVARLLRGDRHAIATYRRHQLKWLTEAVAPEHPDPLDRDW